MATIYKIFRTEEFADFAANGRTRGAPVDLSDGYIHFSTAEQVAETAAKHFAGEEGLKLLAIDTSDMGDALVWEPSRGGALFPHLYGELLARHVIWARDLPLSGATHDFSGLLP